MDPNISSFGTAADVRTPLRRTRLRRLIRGLVTFIVSAHIATGMPAAAASGDPSEAEVVWDSAATTEELVADALEEEGLELINLEATADEIVVENAVSDGGVESELTLQVGSDVASMVISDPDAPGEGSHEFELTIHELTEELVSFTITDPATGETANYRSDEGVPAFAIVIPIGIAISGAVLSALAKTAAVIVVAGATYVIAKEFHGRRHTYSHYRAVRRDGHLYMGSGMSRSTATAWGKAGNDVWSVSGNQAKELAKAVNPTGQPAGPEIDADRRGKYWHYHPRNRTPHMHSFYGVAQ
jgi:hypothetical protein